MANINPIGASELILTPTGSIYHLDLRPDQIGDTIITVGDPARVAAVSSHFDSIEHVVQHREFLTHTGKLNGKPISVISTGIGPDNIDIVLNELDALVNIDFETRLPKQELKSLNIIRIGTSGGLQPDLPPDSMVVSAKTIGLDNVLHYYKYQNTEEDTVILEALVKHTNSSNSPLRPYIASASDKLASLFGDNFHKGITITCPGFFGPQGRILRAEIMYPDLIDSLMSFKYGEYCVMNMEMETSALLGLGSVLGHHCISISTNINNRRSKEFTKDLPASVDRMIQAAMEVVATL